MLIAYEQLKRMNCGNNHYRYYYDYGSNSDSMLALVWWNGSLEMLAAGIIFF